MSVACNAELSFRQREGRRGRHAHAHGQGHGATRVTAHGAHARRGHARRGWRWERKTGSSVSRDADARRPGDGACAPVSCLRAVCGAVENKLKKYGTKIRCLHARRTIAVETDRHTTLNWNDALYVSPLPPSINHRSSAAAVDAWAMTPRYANVCANVDKYVERRLTPCGTGWRSILVCVLAGSFILLTRARVALDIGRAPASSASMPG